jgi:uncharacterized protein YcnI
MNQPVVRKSRNARVAFIALAAVLGGYAVAFGHATVSPKTSPAGGRERYTIRVPNERMVPTTRVEIQFPPSIRVTSFYETPGWKLEIVRDTAKRIAGAIWTGSLAPERTVEFSFGGVNPKDPAEIHWPILQKYADGEDANWTGPVGSDRPASVTVISAPVAAAAVDSTSTKAPASSTPWISYAALGLSVISLGIALRGGGKSA